MKILVIGDSCKDIFIYGDIERIAPEAPVPVIVPRYQTFNPGMAMNVGKNIEALSEEVDIITNPNNIKKIRYVDTRTNQLLLRVDDNDECKRIDSSLLRNLEFSQYSAVIISDYCKGFLEEEDIEFISTQHPLTFLDTKKILGKYVNEIKFIKINDLELKRNRPILSSFPKLKNKLIITQGKKGCLYQGEVFPVIDVPVKDVSGAGDTFLAGLVVEYFKSKDIKKAIKFAQKCTEIVVQKHGVSTI